MVAIKQKATKNVKKTNKIEKIKKKPKSVKKVAAPIKINIETDDVSVINKTTVSEKKLKFNMPSKSVTDDVVNSCLNALQQLTIHYKKKNTILEDDTPIFAEIHCIKIQSTKGNIKFVLPHSTFASTGEICLITPDLKKGRKVDHEPTVDHWEDLLKKEGVTGVKTVLPLRQLKVEYDQYELKRRLLTQHDFIMVDTRVLNHASHILGKMFFKKHNMLVPVRLENKKMKDAIDIGLRTSMLRLNVGETSTIVVGHTGMPQEKVKENILSLVDQIRTKYPGGESNIRSICLKLPLSLSLPLYMTLRPSNTVHPPKLRHKKPNNFKVVEGELSTQPGHLVKVGPEGSVHLVKTDDDVHTSDSDSDDGNITTEEKDVKSDAEMDSD